MGWFERQNVFRFYASSILLTYDSADPPEGVGVEEEVEVRMIDFAHAVPVDGEGPNGKGPAEAPGDEGYLYGLNNVSVTNPYAVELSDDVHFPQHPRSYDVCEKLGFVNVHGFECNFNLTLWDRKHDLIQQVSCGA